MAFKIFRLHTAAATSTDWHETQKLAAAQIDTIKDPADAHFSVPVTSIPTPFARIFLVQDAFAKINKDALSNPQALSGTTSHHKLISDVWDMAQLMFNIDGFRAGNQQIDIVRWDKGTELAKLRAGVAEHQLLARTLDLFWKDALGSQEQVYVISHNHKVIGGTSPKTLFFTNPNSDNFTKLKHGDDELFDNSFNPLYKRDAAFIRFIYLFFEAQPQLRRDMALIYEHLNINKKMLSGEFQTELNSYANLGTQNALSKLQADYEVSNVSGAGTDIWLLPNINLYKLKSQTASAVSTSSDFIIGCYQNPNSKNTKSKSANLPLVLQNDFHNPFNYWGGRWTHTTKVPFYEPASLEERRLPDLSVKYPYLTVSDFLESHLLELPFKTNEKYFFNGNAKNFLQGNKQSNEQPDFSFLIPIKREFFQYFNTKDLLQTLPDGKKVLEMEKQDNNCVKVTLRVPIQKDNQYLTFERFYFRNTAPNLAQNKGAIVPALLNAGFFPFLNSPSIKNKRFALIEKDENRQLFDIHFYQNDKVDFFKPSQETVSSDMGKNHFVTSRFMQIDEKVDYIHLRKQEQQGLIIPIYPDWHQGGKSFTFAIDFGTTTSHIEYTDGESLPKAFEVGEKDVQLITLDDKQWESSYRELQNYFLYEMIPSEIGKEFDFPTRTALAETQHLNFSGALMTYGDFNPAFYYEKYKLLPQYNLVTKLKWSVGGKTGEKDSVAADKRIEAYLESLLILIKNKVLLNEGNLANTQIIWFAPSSMGGLALNTLSNAWETLHARHFAAAPKLIKYSESDSPYYHVEAKAIGVRPSLSIDIGGGSTDVVIFKSKKPVFLTSFRFAGGALFGTGHNEGASLENGLLQRFKPQVDLFFSENYYSLLPLIETFEQIGNPNKGNAADLISFFFSLSNNATLQKNKLQFDFTSLLQKNTDFKVIYFVFYAAIQYHIAKMCKKLGVEMPQHIFFSGNGSKIINLLDNSADWRLLSQITVLIYRKVYGKDAPKDVTLHKSNEPKAATCKGGIAKFKKNMSLDEEIPVLAYVGNETEEVVAAQRLPFDSDFADKTSRLSYQEVIDNIETCRNSAVAEVNNFLQFIFAELDNDYLTDFGIPIGKIRAYHKVMQENLEGHFQAGLDRQIAMSDAAARVSESLFFYPIVGALHNLGIKIANNQI